MSVVVHLHEWRLRRMNRCADRGHRWQPSGNGLTACAACPMTIKAES